MQGVALKMLFGDTAKALGLVFGIAFATLLVTQQGGMFVSLMLRTQNVIADAQEANLWVMDPAVDYFDAARPMRDIELARVRGIEGVAWAVPMFRATTPVKTPEGRTSNALMLGIDDVTLIGASQRFIIGGIEDLRRPDAIAIDRVGYMKLWPGEALRVGRTIELNDRRAVITAITDASAAFTAQIVIYTRYSLAVSYLPTGRNTLSFVLGRTAPGESPEAVARAITARTGLKALSAAEFSQETIEYYLRNTGIPISFGTVIVLGFVVGIVIVGLTFNMFIADNIRQYAALKAIGLNNFGILRMVLTQAAVVALIGYGIGLGLAASFFAFACTPTSDLRGFFLPWWVAAGSAVAIVLVVLLATFVGLRRVLVLDPAIVFRG